MAIRIRAFLAGVCCAGCAVAAQPVQAQDGLQYDPQRRIYTLTYVDDEGLTRRIEIVPPNHVNPEMMVTLGDSPTGMKRYRYTLTNQTGPFSSQPVFMVDILCPPAEAVSLVEAPEGWFGTHRFHSALQTFTCAFNASTSEGLLFPGSSVGGFAISSRFMPEIVEARIWGEVPEPPSLEGVLEVDPELAELWSQATGADGGWFELPVVAPGRDPAQLAEPVSGVQILIGDLDRTCALAWIDPAGVCQSLRAKLEHTAASLARGGTRGARGQLQSFLAELEAQHGPPSGKHVNDNAYWLLKANAEFVLGTF